MSAEIKVLSDPELLAELDRILEFIQAQRLALGDEAEADPTHIKHPLFQDLLDIEFYCIEAKQDLEQLGVTLPLTPNTKET